MHQSMNLEYEPSSEPLHISAKQLLLNLPVCIRAEHSARGRHGAPESGFRI